MPFFRCLLPSLLLMLFSLLSCSSHSEYPYTIVAGDPCGTRLYTLPGGVKLYVARTTDQPRLSAALYMPSVASDTLGNLCSESVFSREYPMLFARIGSDVSRVIDYKGSTLVCNNIPSNELENWAVIMQGSFTALPDSLSIVLYGDVVYDDAVATMVRHFEKISHLPSAVAAADDAVTLLSNIRTRSFGNIPEAEKSISQPDVSSEAKNSIKLLSSPPAKVVFPDADELNIKTASDGSRMVVADGDTAFTFVLRRCMKELPVSFFALIKDYFDASLNSVKDSVSPVTQVKTDKNLRMLEFTVTGNEENMQQNITHTVSLWKSIADGDKFHKYLLANGGVVAASKDNYENIAMQAAAYIAGGKRICGTRELARYSMDALFASSGEVCFSGKNADKIYALLPDMFNSAATPSLADFSAEDDTLPRYFLLPSDADSAVTVTLVTAYEGVEDYATIALFNKAASLSNVLPSAQFYSHGALLSASDCAPFTRDAFEAAKSFLLYDCSTYGSNAQSLFKEYGILKACGYTSSQFYDALMRLSFSDVEDFYVRHKENAVTQLIIGRESSLNLREIKNNGRVVHLTSAELFGY